MAKYKDVDKLMAILEYRCNEADNVEAWLAFAMACEDVRDLPAADVEEVRYGHWEKVDDNPYEYVAACSVCRNEVKQPTCMLKPIYSYCPICGARMVNEDEEVYRRR